MSLWQLSLVALLSFGCREGGPSAGSNSNWLQSCQTDANCPGATACRCGTCTRQCTADADCSELDDARCVPQLDPAIRSLCGASSVESGLCLPSCQPGTCGEGRVCMLGACVIVPPANAEQCAALDAPSESDRTREDEVLDAFQRRRLEGGVACGRAMPSEPGLALRFDARLACAARLVATDVTTTGGYGPTDSLGRTATDRIAVTGYSVGFWGEGVAVGARAPERALDLMLADSGACVGLTTPVTVDVGVAHVGDVDVLTVAAP